MDHDELQNAETPNWHREMAIYIRKTTGCTHEVAMDVVGKFIEIHLNAWNQRWCAGYNAGAEETRSRFARHKEREPDV